MGNGLIQNRKGLEAIFEEIVMFILIVFMGMLMVWLFLSRMGAAPE